MKNSGFPVAISYSKSEINRCGDVLRKGAGAEEYARAFGVVSAWRASHLYPLNTFQASVTKHAGGLHGSIVAQRLKRMPTIIAKLERNSGMELSRMQDVGGLRVVVNNVREVEKLKEYYLSREFTHSVVRKSDYIVRPKQDGYRGVHLVFKYVGNNEIARTYDGLLIELQIRTKLQHTWATAVEMASFLLDQKLKNDEGDYDWLDFFKLVSEAFELIEYLDEGEKYISPKHKTGEEVGRLYDRIGRLNSQIGALDKLRAFSSAMRFLDKTVKRQKYFIIEMDPVNRRVRIEGFNRDQYKNAVKRYEKLEQRNRDTSIDQVLVSTSSLKQLKRAYPNYFVNIDDFAAKVSSIVKK